MRKFYTIDDLYNFCKENHYEKFSSIEKGAPLIVQSFGTFETEDTKIDGLLSVKLKSCHTGKNRNRSGISDETMELYKSSFKGRPILGAIYKTDTGEYEFRAHDMEIVEDGDDVDIKYIEQPIGVISQIEEPYLEFDKDAQKNYLMVSGTIFSDYSKAAEILERRRTCKCSVEIAVEEMSYNCVDDYLSIDKFHFCGVTILGYQQDGVTEIQEGMAGSKITIDNFSEQQNSMFANNCQEKLIEALDKLNLTLSSFNILNLQKGGDEEMDNVETVVVVNSEVETEETAIEETVTEQEEVETAEEIPSDDSSTSEDGDNEETVVVVNNKKQYSTDEHGNVTVSFQISHEDIRGALYNLIAIYEEEDNEWYWINSVYDDHFIFENWMGNKFYQQSYAKDGDNVSLSGERQEMFSMLLTESEKLSIDKMREDYAVLECKYNELKEFKDKYDAAELHSQREAVLNSEEYSILSECEDFKALVSDMDKYSVEDLKVKADLVFAKFVKSKADFSAKDNGNKKSNGIMFNFSSEDKDKPKAYGNLFD